jgi:hypothetical protein
VLIQATTTRSSSHGCQKRIPRRQLHMFEDPPGDESINPCLLNEDNSLSSTLRVGDVLASRLSDQPLCFALYRPARKNSLAGQPVAQIDVTDLATPVIASMSWPPTSVLIAQTDLHEMQRARSGLRIVRSTTSQALAFTQVKHRGQYPVHRLQSLRDFSASTSLWQIVAIIALTPVPCLLSIASFELRRLNPPSDGLIANRGFYAREFATFCFISGTLVHQACSVVGPALPISTRRLVGIVLCDVITGTGGNYLLALAFGFPVPFATQVCAPSHFVITTMGLFCAWRSYLRDNSNLTRRIIRAPLLFVSQASMIFTYPIYYYVFTLIPEASTPRLAFLCLLPVLKIINRRLFYHAIRQAESDENEDVPLRVVFNADVMGCLFTAFCMQYKPSALIVAAFVLAKIIQAMLMLREIRNATRDVTSLRECIRERQETQRLTSSRRIKILDRFAAPGVLDEVVSIYARVHGDKLPARVSATTQPTPITLETNWRWLTTSRVTPIVCIPDNTDATITKPVEPLSLPYKQQHPKLGHLERQYANRVRKLLFMTEFMILVEYVEVIIPLVYCAYRSLGVYRLPDLWSCISNGL